MKITKEYTLPIINWVSNPKNHHLFVDPRHPQGFVRGIPRLDKYSIPLIKAKFPYGALSRIENEIISHWDLNPIARCEMFGAFISYSEQGHYVHTHCDVTDNGLHLTRFNVMILKPLEGGEAVINDKVVEVEENEVWVCHASRDPHGSVEIKGNKPRLALSFGYYFDDEGISKIK